VARRVGGKCMTLEVSVLGIDVEQRRRRARVKRRPERRKPTGAGCGSPAPLDHVLTRASAIMGQEVKRDKLYDICGTRDGSKAQKEPE